MMIIAIADAAVQKRGEGPPPDFLVFAAVWAALALASFLFFHFSRNAALKRAVFPIFILLIGMVFGGYVYFTAGLQQPQVLYVAVPAIVVISIVNIRTTRFCDSCGRTLYRQPLFARTQFCPYCGAELR